MHDTPIIPPVLTAPITTTEELHQHWWTLMQPLGFAQRQLWVLFLDILGRVNPTLPVIEDLPPFPSARALNNVALVCLDVLKDVDPCGSVALLLARPGPSAPTISDRAWTKGLDCHSASNRLRLRPVFVAGDDGIVLPATTRMPA